jgi:hypothetical protein
MTIKKNGGIWFIRVGRYGGSFYVSKARPVTNEWLIAMSEDRAMLSTLSAIFAFVSYIAVAY